MRLNLKNLCYIALRFDSVNKATQIEKSDNDKHRMIK